MIVIIMLLLSLFRRNKRKKIQKNAFKLIEYVNKKHLLTKQTNKQRNKEAATTIKIDNNIDGITLYAKLKNSMFSKNPLFMYFLWNRCNLLFRLLFHFFFACNVQHYPKCKYLLCNNAYVHVKRINHGCLPSENRQ